MSLACKVYGPFHVDEVRLQADIDKMYLLMASGDRRGLDQMFNACYEYDAGTSMGGAYLDAYTLGPIQGKATCEFRIVKGVKRGTAVRAWCKVRRQGQDFVDFIMLQAIHPEARIDYACTGDFDFTRIDPRRQDPEWK